MEQRKLLMLQRKVNSVPLVVKLLAGVLIGASAVAQAATYRWVDESGGVVFSQTPPPPGVEASLVGKPPPGAEPPEVARERLEQQLKAFEERRNAEQRAKEEAEKAAALEKQREEGCAAARFNIGLYEDTPPNRLINDGTGNYRRFSEEERAVKIEEARAYLEKHCQ